MRENSTLYNSYASNLGNEHSWDVATHETRRLLEHSLCVHLPPSKDARILDLGCGNGALVHALRQHGYDRVNGVDWSPEQIEYAHSHGVLNVVMDDIHSFVNKSDEIYDCIIMIDVLEHLSKEDALSILAKCRHMLSQGGKLLLRVPNNVSPIGYYYQACDYTHRTAFTPRSLGQLLRSAGYQCIRYFPFPPIPDRPVSMLRYFFWLIHSVFRRWAWLVETGGIGPVVLTGNLGCEAQIKSEVDSEK